MKDVLRNAPTDGAHLYRNPMKYRKPLRLTDYDYSTPGLYYVTICVANRECRLSSVREGEIVLSPEGSIVDHVWQSIPDKYSNVSLDTWVIMPNHVHGVLCLNDIISSESPALGDVIKTFKSASTLSINLGNNTPRAKLWQSRFYDHVVRSEKDLDRIRLYIAENPGKWADDPDNPENIRFRSVGPPIT